MFEGLKHLVSLERPFADIFRDLIDILIVAFLIYRALVVLKHVQDFSYEQIAAILDCPVKTVKSRLFTARRSLRDRLVAHGWVSA